MPVAILYGRAKAMMNIRVVAQIVIISCGVIDIAEAFTGLNSNIDYKIF